MKKRKTIVKKTVLFLCVIALLVNISLLWYEKITQTSFYFCAISSELVHLALWSVLVLLLLLLICLTRMQIINKLLLALLIIAVTSYMNFGYFLGVIEADYYTLYNPNGEQYIVSREVTSAPGAGCVLYTSTNRFFIKQIGEGSGYLGNIRPFRDGLYSVEWRGNSAILTYAVSGYNPDQTESVCIEFD